jgi:DNA topoisomerase-1
VAENPAMEAAEDAGLHYVSDTMPGNSRRRSGLGFRYFDSSGKPIIDPKSLQRIRTLAIPPAYERVWICPDPKGHLQATGVDDRGRKQYIYHPRFREVRDEDKFNRMLEFGRLLPRLRKQVKHDLGLAGLQREKILAAVVCLLDRSLIRVGNEEYAKENKSFGLTTMRNRHVKVKGSRIEFNFLGKSGISHRIEVSDRRLARIVKQLQDLPGQELFQFEDEDGCVGSISSSDVNDYLQRVTGEHFTAKDFRTWWGTLLALIELGNQDAPTTKSEEKRVVTMVMKAVSKQLGNTPAICRKSYVHPCVVAGFQAGSLPRLLTENEEELVVRAEKTLMKLLKSG